MTVEQLRLRPCWPLLIGAVAVAGSTACQTTRRVGYDEARMVVNRRCVECHSEHPTNRAFPIAPKGVMLDTALGMKQYAQRIQARVAGDRTMPLANMSGMTDQERWVLARWVETGAEIPSSVNRGVPAGPHAPPGSVLVNVTMVGFDPASIEAQAGQPIKLAFFRPNAANCAREVVFPGLGIRKELPPGQTVVVEVTPPKSGPFRFECGMGMLKGQLIVR
jgi:hypothetical protein